MHQAGLLSEFQILSDLEINILAEKPKKLTKNSMTDESKFRAKFG